MRAIIKHYPGEKYWSTVFCVGDVACDTGGFVSHSIFEKMHSKNLLHEVEHTEIIEKYFRHSILISDVKLCRYYEIGNRQ